MAKEMTKGTTFRCTKEGCGAEIQVTKNCQCQDECGPTCCGEKMQRL